MAVDRISSLPDEIICNILSFLPIIQAVRTMILSKRWKQVFRLLSILNFNYEDFSTIRSFRRFVDALIMSPLSTNTLKSVTLYSRFGNHQHCDHLFNTWSQAVIIRHRVQEFHLNYLGLDILNPNIFISEHLVVLKLECLKIAIDTSSVYLPSLKTLFLYIVGFENPNNFINFLLACPNLQDLHAEDNYDEDNTIEEERFKLLTLSKLVKANIRAIDFMFEFVKNVEYLSIIAFPDEEVSFKMIPTFQNLIHIELEFLHCSFLCWDDVVDLLWHCPKLQIFSITKWIETDSSKEWKCPISVLECVSSHLKSCTILNFDGWPNDLQFAAYILQNASLLQEMKIGVVNELSKGMFLEESQIVEELSSCQKISQACKLSFKFKDLYYDCHSFHELFPSENKLSFNSISSVIQFRSSMAAGRPL